MATVGSRVYLANTYGHPGLTVIDASDPSAPALLGSYDAPRDSFDIIMEWLIRVVLPVGFVAVLVALVIRVKRRRRVAPSPPERARFALRFWPYWILATALGMGAGMGMGWLLGFGLRSPAAVAVGKGLPWLVVGLIQWYALRREVAVTGWWVGAYASGATVVASLALVIGWYLGDIPAAAGLLVGGMGGLIVGSVVGWAVGLAVGFLSVHGLGWAGSAGETRAAVRATAGAIAGTVGGALTGIALVWLLRHPLPQTD